MTFNRFNEKSKNSRNSRIDSLCIQIGIKDRRFNKDIFDIDKEIDYQEIDNKIEELRKKSKNFLEIALKNNME